jgi:hypothetical protein
MSKPWDQVEKKIEARKGPPQTVEWNWTPRGALVGKILIVIAAFLALALANGAVDWAVPMHKVSPPTTTEVR